MTAKAVDLKNETELEFHKAYSFHKGSYHYTSIAEVIGPSEERIKNHTDKGESREGFLRAWWEAGNAVMPQTGLRRFCSANQWCRYGLGKIIHSDNGGDSDWILHEYSCPVTQERVDRGDGPIACETCCGYSQDQVDEYKKRHRQERLNKFWLHTAEYSRLHEETVDRLTEETGYDVLSAEVEELHNRIKQIRLQMNKQWNEDIQPELNKLKQAPEWFTVKGV